MSVPVPVYSSLEEVYVSTPELISRYQAVKDTFSKVYGCNPDFYVRAPGRVNLIGEHIDYHEYSVLPMAIQQDCIIGVASCENKENAKSFAVHNVDEKYQEGSIPIDSTVDVRKEHHWSLYFHCGYKGAFEYLEHEPISSPRLLKIVVSGNVPPAAGVSSSSSFVVASCIATAKANNIPIGKNEVAEACRKAEYYIGTMGGGMDQAASCLGQRGYALHVKFNPLQVTPLSTPSDGVFVITNTFYQVPKAITAAKGFNLRVVEGRLAAKLIAKKLGLESALEYKTLRSLQVAAGNKTLEEMVDMCKQHLHAEPYTTKEIEELLGVELKQEILFSDRPAAAAVLSVNDEFRCLQRALHVYSEANRVEKFRDVCLGEETPSTLTTLGDLMNESHTSCHEQYDCSCAELNELVDIARRNGSKGSRLTGAGWGGCAVHLVPEDKVTQVVQACKEEYYEKRGFSSEQIKEGVFTSKPSAGACCFENVIV